MSDLDHLKAMLTRASISFHEFKDDYIRGPLPGYPQHRFEIEVDHYSGSPVFLFDENGNLIAMDKSESYDD